MKRQLKTLLSGAATVFAFVGVVIMAILVVLGLSALKAAVGAGLFWCLGYVIESFITTGFTLTHWACFGAVITIVGGYFGGGGDS